MKYATIIITTALLSGCAITQPEAKPWDWTPPSICDYGTNPGVSIADGEVVWIND